MPGRRAAMLMIALALTLGCGSERRLRLVVGADPLTPQIGSKLSEAFRDADFELEVVAGTGSVANLERLQRGEADLAIVENNAAYRDGVRALLPLYRSVLHVLHERGEAPGGAYELFRSKKIFAGEPGGMGRWFLGLVTRELGIPAESYTVVEDFEDSPQVVFVFRPISPAVTAGLEDRYEFYSVGEPAELGRGALVEGLALEYPQLEPFVIPVQTYGRANPRAVLTVSVATLLVAHEDLADDLAYDLVEAVVDHKQVLAQVHPSLFTEISDHFETDGINFPLHPGARDYLARDKPGFLERYAELAGVSFSVTLATLSGLVALLRWREYTRKRRIDEYYAKVLRIRAASLEWKSEAAFAEAAARVRQIEGEAFAELIDERLGADESFRIFVTLATDVIENLEKRRAEVRSGSVETS